MVMSLLIATSLLTQSPRSKLLSSRRFHSHLADFIADSQSSSRPSKWWRNREPKRQWQTQTAGELCVLSLWILRIKKKCHNNTKIKIETTFFFNCDSKQTIGWVFFSLIAIGLIFLVFFFFFFFLGIGNGILQRLVQHQPTQYPASEEMRIGKIKFKAFDLGGHQIARRVWKDYYAKVDRSIYQLSLMRMFS